MPVASKSGSDVCWRCVLDMPMIGFGFSLVLFFLFLSFFENRKKEKRLGEKDQKPCEKDQEHKERKRPKL